MSSERDPGAPEPPASSGADDPLVRPIGDPAADDPGGGPTVAPAEPPSRAPESSRAPEPSRTPESRNMLPGRERRRSVFERLLVRLIATCGIVGIGVAIAAIMVSSKSQGWVVGLVVSIVSVVLSAILWSSRQL
jgi:hypothetical protein